MASNETASANGISLNQNDPVFKSVGLILAITSGKFNYTFFYIYNYMLLKHYTLIQNSFKKKERKYIKYII